MGNLKQKLSKLFSLGEVNPVQDEKLIFKILLACERASIIVVAVVSGVAVAAYGYLLASGYTEWEVVRWATAALLFILATAITDVGVKYFIQKGAFDFFSAFNPSTYKDSKTNWKDVLIIIVAGILTLACFHYCEVNKFVDDLIDLEWGRVTAKYAIKVLLFCVFISISEASLKTFLDYNPVGNFSWFQRSMQVVGWSCMVALIAGMFLFDYYSVDAVRNPVANMVKKESKLNQDSIRQITANREDTRVGAVNVAINGVQADINATRRQIKAEKVRAANSNQEMKRLADSGNGWAESQIKAAQAKAAAPLQQRLAEQEGLKKELREQQARDLAYKSAVITKSDSTVFATNAAIESRNNDLVKGTSTMFIWLGFFAKCIAGLIRVMLVVLFLGNPVDANKDGKVDYRDVTSAAAGGFLAA
jgi:hypothetical protein